jgi:long-subunit fatty acid transport protein
MSKPILALLPPRAAPRGARSSVALPLLLALALALVGAGPVHAAVVGSIFSNPTTGDGASLFNNPAAMTLGRGTWGLAFGAITAVRLGYSRATPSAYDGRAYPEANALIAKPNAVVGAITDATLDRFRFGLGLALPFVDGAQWPGVVDGRPSSTRYFALDAKLAELLIEAAVAVRVTRWLSLGIGIDAVGLILGQDVMTDFGSKIDQMACAMTAATSCALDSPFRREDPSLDALTKIGGMGWGVGVIGGVLITPAPWIRLGLGVHSGGGTISIPVDLSVELPTAVQDYVRKNLPSVTLPPLEAQGNVSMGAPLFVTAGVAVRPMPALEIVADLHFSQTSRTSVMIGTISRSSTSLIGNQVLIKARTDTFNVGLTGTYQLRRAVALALRFEFENNSRPDEFTCPVSIDFTKFSLHAGALWQATRWLGLSLEYGHYFFVERDIASSRFAPNSLPTTAVEEGFDHPSPTGHYSVGADRVGLGITVGFGR